MTTSNINIVLANAVCCVATKAIEVSKLFSIGDKCAYKALVKLKLLNHYIETLRCWKNDPTSSVFINTISLADYNTIFVNSISGTNFRYTFIINGISYNIIGDGITTVKNLLTVLNSKIILTYVGALIITTPCEVTSIKFTITDIIENSIITNHTYLLQSPGQCVAGNCLTSDEIDIIIEKIMLACDICACELTT